MAFDTDAFLSVPASLFAMVFALGTLIAGARKRPLQLVLASALLSFAMQIAAYRLLVDPVAPLLGSAMTCVGLVLALFSDGPPSQE